MSRIKKKGQSNVAEMLKQNRGAGGDAKLATSQEAVLHIPVAKIRRDPAQPRKVFSEEAIKGLAESLKEHGQTAEIKVWFDDAADQYELIAGERRWRAAKYAGIEKLRAVLVDPAQPRKVTALVDNLQREDLHALETALAIEDILASDPDMSARDLGKRLGMAEQVMSRYRRVAKLPDVIQSKYFEIKDDKDRPNLSILYEISRVDDPIQQTVLWDRVQVEKLSTKNLREVISNNAGDAGEEQTEAGEGVTANEEGNEIAGDGEKTTRSARADARPEAKSIRFLERHSESIAQNPGALTDQDRSDLAIIRDRINAVLND